MKRIQPVLMRIVGQFGREMDQQIAKISADMKALKQQQYAQIWSNPALTDHQKTLQVQHEMSRFPSEFHSRINAPFNQVK